MDGNKVLAGVKSPTTADVMCGVVAALKSALRASGFSPEKIDPKKIAVFGSAAGDALTLEMMLRAKQEGLSRRR